MRLAFFLIFLPLSIFSQQGGNYQSHANSLLPTSKILSLIGGVNEGEKILLAWDFALSQTISTSFSSSGNLKGYVYRLNHTLIGTKYHFDSWSITNDAPLASYTTSSGENYLTYVNRLKASGFKFSTTRPEGDVYERVIDGVTYIMVANRSMHQGTPNYNISVVINDEHLFKPSTERGGKTKKIKIY